MSKQSDSEILFVPSVPADSLERTPHIDTFASLVASSRIYPPQLKDYAIRIINQDLVTRLGALNQKREMEAKSNSKIDKDRLLNLELLVEIPYFALDFILTFRSELEGLLEGINRIVASGRDELSDAEDSEKNEISQKLSDRIMKKTEKFLRENWQNFQLFFVLLDNQDKAEEFLENMKKGQKAAHPGQSIPGDSFEIVSAYRKRAQ